MFSHVLTLYRSFLPLSVRYFVKSLSKYSVSGKEERASHDILDASLNHVPELGWSRSALEAGAQSLGYSPTAASCFSDIQLIQHHYRTSNESLENFMLSTVSTESNIKIGPFIRQAVEYRLRRNVPYINRWPEAMAIMTLPGNITSSLRLCMDLVDSIWHFAGDKSTDYNWYTKRIILAAIFKCTELAMIQDKSEDFSETWKFLDRRFKDHQNFNECLQRSKDFRNTIYGMALTVQNIIGIPR